MDTPTRSLAELARSLEARTALDAVADSLTPVARALADSEVGGLLRGEPLGHAAHPLLTDWPLGCFMSATLVDVLAPRRGASAARRLVGMGLLGLPLTAATGLVDWHHAKDDPRVRRIGALHAVANVVAGGLYLSSFRHRRRGHRVRGIGLTVLGSLVSSGAGYLGGHMAFGYGAGDGERLPGTVPEGTPAEVLDPPDAPIADQMAVADAG
jgi:uncharacterized membrane protein